MFFSLACPDTVDPFVRGSIGSVKFSTKHVPNTRNPKWLDAFKFPIVEWHASTTTLTLEVLDHNTMTAHVTIGRCLINLNDFRDGARHEMWLPLQNAKTGRLRVAITDLEEKLEVRSELMEVIPGVFVENWKVQTEQLKGKTNVA